MIDKKNKSVFKRPMSYDEIQFVSFSYGFVLFITKHG